MDLPERNVRDCLREDLKLLLDSGRYNELKLAMKSSEYQNEIFFHCSEVLPLFVNKLNEEIRSNDYELYDCCESVIYLIAELADPNDALIEFMELAEKPDEELFLIMLKAMQISLMKVLEENKSALNWCLNTIIRHINDMPQTEDFKLEGDEYVILENADSSRTLIKLYKEIILFLEPIVSHVLTTEKTYESECQYSILIFLLKLLGRPLVCMKLEFSETKGEFRLIAENILREIAKFKLELTHFLNFVRPYNRQRKTTVTNVVDQDFDNVSLGSFYYLIFKEEVCVSQVSHVYHPLFLLQSLTVLSLDMLVIEHSSVQNKGLLLLETGLKRVADFYLNIDCIQYELYGKISKRISKIIIYSDVKENRILGAKVFRLLLEKFNSKGRYYILFNIQDKVPHPNFVGYIITITKDFVITALKNRSPLDLLYFTGPNLCEILKKYCKLHRGAESDLIELSDQIIAALNFVRFLLIRDSGNTLELPEFFPHFEQKFVEPLKIGLSLSIAHYKLQKTELTSNVPDGKINVSVGGLQLPSLSNEEKLGILDSAINTFDLIEALVARVEECLHEFKLKHTV